MSTTILMKNLPDRAFANEQGGSRHCFDLEIDGDGIVHRISWAPLHQHIDDDILTEAARARNLRG